MELEIKSGEGLWHQLNKVPLYTSLTLKDFENEITEFFTREPPEEQLPEIPAGYLLHVTDKEFIMICNAKVKWKFGMCGPATKKLIQERYDKLIK